jgi:hypothetical protein
MSGGQRPLPVAFWLLEAPDSLAEQSRRNPDGYGIGTFDDDGAPEVRKRPAVAIEDEEFARRARNELSRMYVAHKGGRGATDRGAGGRLITTPVASQFGRRGIVFLADVRHDAGGRSSKIQGRAAMGMFRRIKTSWWLSQPRSM